MGDRMLTKAKEALARGVDWDAYYTERRIDPAVMTQEQFDSLPEYSCSRPTGVYLGKQWRSDLNAFTGRLPEWVLWEYVPTDDPRIAHAVIVPWPVQ